MNQRGSSIMYVRNAQLAVPLPGVEVREDRRRRERRDPALAIPRARDERTGKDRRAR